MKSESLGCSNTCVLCTCIVH